MFNDIHEVTVESLKARATLIHYFGLGFIQIKLGQTYRMHFYTPELPAIVSEEDVHDHRYGFTSRILAGAFLQERYAIVPGATHLLGDEACREGFVSDTPPQPCAIEKIAEERYARGESYTLTDAAFHRVRATDCITFLERGPIVKPLAKVARPVGAPPICPFSKKVPEHELWEIVGTMIAHAKEAFLL